MPFSEALGVDLEIADPGTVVGTLVWSAERCTSDGVLHGGALMSLADTVGAICAYLNLPEGTATSTIESTTNFFRGCAQGWSGYAQSHSTSGIARRRADRPAR